MPPVVSPDEVAPSPGGSVVSSKRGASPDNGDEGGGGKKKRNTGAGNRGVANLTPEQLLKKRENDREAQRNIRRRTKEQIESLERQIQELTSQQPYQEFLAMKRAKEAVEKENADIKQRLSAIISDAQGLIGGDAGGRSYVSPSTSYHSGANSIPPQVQNNVSTPGSAASPAASMEIPHHNWAGGPGTPTGQQSESAKQQLQQQRHEMRHGLDMGPERLGLGFLLKPSQTEQVTKIQNGQNGAQDTSRFQHVPMKHDWTDIRNDQALRARPSGSNITSAGWEPSPASRPSSNYTQPPSGSGFAPEPSGIPRYATPIKNCDPTCPLDSLLLDFLSERRQRAAEGLSASEVVGPRYPSVSSLLNPSHSAQSHPLSKVFTDILSTFPDISTLPERVAVLYIMFLIMRWQISPTKENYARLPEWIRPQDSQIYTPHPAWIDHIPWPAMRENMARAYDPNQHLFDNFFIPFTTTIRLSWPYEETDTLLQSPEGDELMINPVFERHLRNLDNWTLGEPFAKTFPDLVGLCNIDYSTKGAKSR